MASWYWFTRHLGNHFPALSHNRYYLFKKILIDTKCQQHGPHWFQRASTSSQSDKYEEGFKCCCKAVACCWVMLSWDPEGLHPLLGGTPMLFCPASPPCLRNLSALGDCGAPCVLVLSLLGDDKSTTKPLGHNAVGQVSVSWLSVSWPTWDGKGSSSSNATS